MKKSLTASFVLSLLFCALSLPGWGDAAFTGTSQALAAEMGAACADCHQEIVTGFNTSFHGRIWKGSGLASNCENCHGLTDEHVASPTMTNVIAFTSGGGRSADELSRQCLTCHDSSVHLAMWDMGQHSRNDVACVTCHTIHTTRNQVNQPEVCYTCHRSIRAQVNKQSHHPIIEGKILCSDCHNTHGNTNRRMIRAESVNELCYSCHAEKRGPYVFEHAPVEENCAICHVPHGSRHAKLMAEKIPNLCQDCHDWSRHPGTPYDATTGFTGSSPSNRFFSRSCLNCHGAIHGSSNFENHRLTR